MILDIGCGQQRRATNHIHECLGMDKYAGPGVDVVHDIETFPWPFKDETFDRLVAWHVFEHLKPWLMIDLMNECWRVLQAGKDFDIGMPCPGTASFYQDPAHIRTWNEATPYYFDPSSRSYLNYTPKPWQVVSIRRYPKKVPPGVPSPLIPNEAFHFILRKRAYV